MGSGLFMRSYYARLSIFSWRVLVATIQSLSGTAEVSHRTQGPFRWPRCTGIASHQSYGLRTRSYWCQWMCFSDTESPGYRKTVPCCRVSRTTGSSESGGARHYRGRHCLHMASKSIGFSQIAQLKSVEYVSSPVLQRTRE